MIAIGDVPHALVTVNGLLHAGETTLEQLQRRAAGMQHDPHTGNRGNRAHPRRSAARIRR